MKGRVDITAATLLQRAIPNPTFTKVVDPLNFTVTDQSGHLLLGKTLFLASADVTNGGGLTWSNDRLSFDASSRGESAHFAINDTPLSGSPSTLLLAVQNGEVLTATASGPLFDSLLLPTLGSPGSFSLALPNQFTFDYDLSGLGNQPTTARAEWSEAALTQTLPEPGTLTLLGIATVGLLGLAAYSRRRGRRAAVSALVLQQEGK
jgi:hypothetical protein